MSHVKLTPLSPTQPPLPVNEWAKECDKINAKLTPRQKLFNYIADLTGHSLMNEEINDIEFIVKGEKQYLKEANELMIHNPKKNHPDADGDLF